MKSLTLFIIGLMLIGAAPQALTQADHENHDENGREQSHDEHEGESSNTHLSAQQMELANIRVVELLPQRMDYQVYSPGEIKANGYTSYIVSPRVDSVVLRRHVALGDQVEKGQVLVTLFSETVAEAQASFRIANAEWQRVQQLGRKTVGENRYVTAEAEYGAAQARLIAYGLSADVIATLKNSSSTLGEYNLIAANHGVVRSDDFHQGQRVQAGQSLMDLADEQELWVEAHLAPTAHLDLPFGSLAQVQVGESRFLATVTQEAHTIDPITRTRVVRLLLKNDGHRLHPGLFADVYFEFVTDDPVLAVPEAALMRSGDGDWTIFIEVGPGEFQAHEIELGRSLGLSHEISGIDPGSRVVIEGAFFLASQLAKDGFDPHNH